MATELTGREDATGGGHRDGGSGREAADRQPSESDDEGEEERRRDGEGHPEDAADGGPEPSPAPRRWFRPFTHGRPRRKRWGIHHVDRRSIGRMPAIAGHRRLGR
jgi:hypothetical protein